MPESPVTLELDSEIVEAAVEAALKKVLKDGSVGGLSIDDFKNVIYEMMHDRRMVVAANEAVASARIFADIEGFKAATTVPFRITTAEQLDALTENMKQAIVPKKTQLVIAVAVVETEKLKPFGG